MVERRFGGREARGREGREEGRGEAREEDSTTESDEPGWEEGREYWLGDLGVREGQGGIYILWSVEAMSVVFTILSYSLHLYLQSLLGELQSPRHSEKIYIEVTA